MTSFTVALRIFLVVAWTTKSTFGFVTPFTTKATSRAIAFVSQPVASSDVGENTGVEMEFSSDDNSAAELEEKEPSKPSEPKRHTVFVGNLAFDKSEDDVRNVFAEYGTVELVSIPMDRASGQGRGFAFVDMSTPEELQQAIDGLDGREFGDRVLRVNESLPKDKAKTQARKIVDGSQKMYVGNLAFEATKEDLTELFSTYGEVLDVYIPRDKITGNQRGFAFVTMKEENALKAIEETNGMVYMDRELNVNKPLPPSEKSAGYRKGGRQKLYIGNLSFFTAEDTLREFFEEFGTVHDCYLPIDPDNGKARGFGFVTMDNDAAAAAINETDGCELDGRIIRVNEAAPKGGSKRRNNYNDNSSFDGDAGY